MLMSTPGSLLLNFSFVRTNRRHQHFFFFFYNDFIFSRMCCSSFFLPYISFVPSYKYSHRHPIIDLIRRERENIHVREEEEERLEILFSLSLPFFCVYRKNKSSREFRFFHSHIHLKSFGVCFTSSYINVKKKKAKT